jgi:nucleotide-binding universal stress UspA family protein
MYKKVLVPLDGSQYAQCSLDHVRAIGLGCNVPDVILFRVVETASGGPDAAAGKEKRPPTKIESEMTAEAKDYISSIAKRLKDEGLHVRGELAFGRPDEQIINYSRTNHVDLIIMSTHGRSGIAKPQIGSVTKGVVDFSTVPVLLVLATGCRVSQGGA